MPPVFWIGFGIAAAFVVLGATIAHCEELARQFNEAGISAAVFCATTTPAQREAILKDYRQPDSFYRVLVSVEALAKGFDVPDVGCIVDCRPLRKSLSTFVQMVGRGLRASPETGKADCILLDHSGNVTRFAKDFEALYFDGLNALDAGKKLDAAIRTEKDEEKAKKKCPKCGFTPFLKRCMACGFEKKSESNVSHELGGGMREIVLGGKRIAPNKTDLYNQIATWTKAHGNQATAKGRAAHIFRRIVGGFPPSYLNFETAPNVPVTKAVRDQITHQMTAYRTSTNRAQP